jgi:hypothetical protein
MTKDEQAAIVVFTSETRQSILDKGGSGDWVLSPKNAGRRQYLVCCRKPDWANRAEGIAPKAAFLIGRVASLKKIDASENDRGQPRYQIQLSEYADLPKLATAVWGREKDLRNPVAYDTLKKLGIELRGLKFEPMPAPRPSGQPGQGTPMTIAEAKKALAATFGVKPEDVEITIRG